MTNATATRSHTNESHLENTRHHPSNPRFALPGPDDGPWMMVGVDGTEESAAALRWANEHSDRFGSVVPATAWKYPAWAIVRPPAGAPIAWPESDFVRHAKQRAASVMRLARVDPVVDHFVSERAAGPMLVQESAGADLLVVGTRRRGLASMLGTVGGHCIAHATVPVVVVPPTQSEVKHGRVIVGIDDSPEARAALKWAVEHTSKDHEVHVIHVTNTADETYPWLRQTIADARAVAELNGGPTITGQILFGPAASTLRLATARADMLVVGSRGRGRIAHALVGSVTTSLCRDPSVPTVVIR